MGEFDSIWVNVHAATMAEHGVIKNACIGLRDRKIAWVGPEKDLPHRNAPIRDGGGRLITPALIDCHTHMVYGGTRADEFEQRLQGASYADIARAGGGILSTVRATRAAPEDDLFASASARMKSLLREGVTTFEIKSGYGLDLETERKMLRVATRLRDDLGLRIRRTFLGAHALPREYAGRSDDYIDEICNVMLPALHADGLVDAVDAFCENIGFSPAQTERIFKTAKKLGLPMKLHAEQLSNQGGAALAARYGALSADHLEYIDEAGVKAMAQAGTVAVLLPAAFYTLQETMRPPIDLFRRHGVPMAIATDHNPGTAPALSLVLMLNMACTLFGLTPDEALKGITVNAARALGLQDICGTIEKGKAADLALWDVNEPRDLCYRIGGNPCAGVIVNGAFFPPPTGP